MPSGSAAAQLATVLSPPPSAHALLSSPTELLRSSGAGPRCRPPCPPTHHQPVPGNPSLPSPTRRPAHPFRPGLAHVASCSRPDLTPRSVFDCLSVDSTGRVWICVSDPRSLGTNSRSVTNSESGQFLPPAGLSFYTCEVRPVTEGLTALP